MSKEKYGISIIMCEATPVLLTEGLNDSTYDYVAEFNYLSSNNGNGHGIVNLLKNGVPCSIQRGEWTILPSINFYFSWSGQSYRYKASCNGGNPIEVCVDNPSEVSAFKRGKDANLGDVRAIFSSFNALSKYKSSIHYSLSQDIVAHKSDIGYFCPPYKYKLNEHQYQEVINIHQKFIEKMNGYIYDLAAESELVKTEILHQLHEIDELLKSLPPLDLSCNAIISSLSELK